MQLSDHLRVKMANFEAHDKNKTRESLSEVKGKGKETKTKKKWEKLTQQDHCRLCLALFGL